jgi:hypothetical protein
VFLIRHRQPHTTDPPSRHQIGGAVRRVKSILGDITGRSPRSHWLIEFCGRQAFRPETAHYDEALPRSVVITRTCLCLQVPG